MFGALWSRGQGCLWSTVKGAVGGDGRRGAVVGSVVMAWNWWVCSRSWRKSPPACHSPPTSNMPYYVDLWRWSLGSTFNWVRPGPSKDLSLRKIKGGRGVCQTKANSEGQPRSWTGRFTLGQPSDHRKTQKKTFQALWRLPSIWQLVNSAGSQLADARVTIVHRDWQTNPCRRRFLRTLSLLKISRGIIWRYKHISTYFLSDREAGRVKVIQNLLYISDMFLAYFRIPQ